MIHRALQMIFIGLTLLVGQASATAQIPDRILIDGQQQMLYSEPLNAYLTEHHDTSAFDELRLKEGCSGSWRGYKAHWEIRDAQLFLLAVYTSPCMQPTELPLSMLFEESTAPILANWYSGTLLVPVGRELAYVHMGYATKYERYLVIDIENGKVVQRRETTERPAN